MEGILFLPEFPQDSPAHIGGLQSLMTVTSLFTDMIGNTPFLNDNSITQCWQHCMYAQVNFSKIKPYLVIWLKSGLNLQLDMQQSAGSPRTAEGALQSRRWTDDRGGENRTLCNGRRPKMFLSHVTLVSGQ